MSNNYRIALVHFSMCIAGACKLSNGPSEVVILWLSRPEVITVMLLVYLALIMIDLINALRWALVRGKKSFSGPPHKHQ